MEKALIEELEKTVIIARVKMEYDTKEYKEYLRREENGKN